jgi:pimeloyl-ACP methyl ester carboxylesterase
MVIEDFYAIHPLKKVVIKNSAWEYITCGSGKKTLLIFPGGGQTAQSNFNLIKELENDYKIIAITIYSVDFIDEFSEAVNMILEKESINKVYLYGLSLGGLLAQSYLRRNKDRVEKVILSHACAPKSPTYENKVIRPLRVLSAFLPLVPDGLIKLITKRFGGKVQGTSKNITAPKVKFDDQAIELMKAFDQDFYQNYLNKRLLKTWINLHMEFYGKEQFSATDLEDWTGKILILRTDNDPLMQDDGEFKKLYPDAQVYTFKETGHLSFHYQFDEMMKVIKEFLWVTGQISLEPKFSQ